MNTRRVRVFFGAVYLGFGLVLTFLLFRGSQNIGVANDEHIHMLDLGEWRWASDPSTKHFGVYGLSFQLVGHVLAWLLGAEDLGVVGFSSTSFGIRHFVSAALTLITAVMVAMITWVIAGSKLWAIWSGAALLAIPTFLGHGMFNPKDIPVALGYTSFTFASIFFVSRLSQREVGAVQYVVIFISGGLGIWIAAGTRLAMFFPLLLVTLTSVAIFLFFSRAHYLKFRKRLKLLGAYLGGYFGGSILVAATNPCLVANYTPECRFGVELLPRMFAQSARYPEQIPTFIAGQIIPSVDSPFWALPLALFVGAPVGILLLSVLGGIFFWESSGSLGRAPTWLSSTRRLAFQLSLGVLVLSQVALIPIFVILTRSTLYDLQRQHLYVYPALCVLAGLGLALISKSFSGRNGSLRNLGQVTVGVVAAVALLVPTAEILRLWPYQYIYVNPLASLGGFQNHWELDYTFLSDRAALQMIPQGAQFRTVGAYWKLKPFLHERGLKSNLGMDELPSEGLEYVVFSRRTGLGQVDVPEECVQLGKVSRTFRGEELILSSANICPKSLSVGVPYADLIAHDP